MRRSPVALALAALALAACAGTGPSQKLPGPRKPVLPSTQSARTPADLVILNTRIYTAATPARAEAIAIRGGRIVAIGSTAKITPHIGAETQIWELPGRAVVPGLIDSHGHVLNLGSKLVNVDLVGTRSYAEIVERVKARAVKTEAGEWVLGRGWDQNDWQNQAMPTHAALSQAVPDHPVALTRIDGHALLVNRAALERAAITAKTPNPTGGMIERDAQGEATGVLVDAAMGLVRSKIPEPGPEETERRLLEAMRACARAGLTMVHDAGIGRETHAAYKNLLARDEFPIRIYAMASATDSLTEDLFRHGRELGDRYTLRAIKAVYDGALGSRGALLAAAYTDRPGHVGLERITVGELARVSARARGAGMQMRTHAIGDLANTRTLDAYERAFQNEPHPELRWAIEHAQIANPGDIQRFARAGVIASIQSTHATSDGPWAEQRIGRSRIGWSYAWRQFLSAGARMANGSDFPVESERPLLGLYAAITRRDLDGKLPRRGWRPHESLTPDEALKSFTIWGAYAAFQERELGSLEVNKLADLVVLDPDPFPGSPEMFPRTLVMKTMVAGKVVWDAEKP